MFRSVVIFLILFVLGLSAWAFFSFSSNEKKPVATLPNQRAIDAAARYLATQQMKAQGYTLALLISGPHPADNSWSVKGSLGRKNSSTNLPFYATLSTVCSEWPNMACWRLKELFVDGREQITAEYENGRTPRINQAPPAEQPSETIPSKNTVAIVTPEKKPDPETTIQRKKEAASGVEKRPRPPVDRPKKSSVKGGPRVWKTVNDRVNARDGPGVKHTIYFKMPSAIDLRLIRKEGEWGFFEYTGANGKVGKVWIAIKLVRALPTKK